jgi:hypothetical protein
MAVRKIGGLILMGFLTLCGASQTKGGLYDTPEQIAGYLSEAWPIVKARCTAFSEEQGPKGPVWVGKFIIPDDFEAPLEPDIVEQAGKPEFVWKKPDDPVAKAGEQITAAWQRREKPTIKPGDDVVLICYAKFKLWLIPGLSVAQYEVYTKARKLVEEDRASAGVKWLAYWLPYLKSDDAFFKAMAHLSVGRSSSDALLGAAGKIPVADLREAFAQGPPPVDDVIENSEYLIEHGGYALMLGVKGDAATDGPSFEGTISQSLAGDAYAIGMDRVLAGYLELAPAAAVKLLERILREKPERFDWRHAILKSLHISLQRKDSKLPREEGLRVLHGLLEDAEINDLVVLELIECNDWSQSRKLEELWARSTKNRQLQHASVRYLLMTQKKGSADEAEQARSVLTALRTKDAAAVQDAEKRIGNQNWFGFGGGH